MYDILLFFLITWSDNSPHTSQIENISGVYFVKHLHINYCIIWFSAIFGNKECIKEAQSINILQ